MQNLDEIDLYNRWSKQAHEKISNARLTRCAVFTQAPGRNNTGKAGVREEEGLDLKTTTAARGL